MILEIDALYDGIISWLLGIISYLFDMLFIRHFWVVIPFAVSVFCSLVLLIARYILVSHYAKQ